MEVQLQELIDQIKKDGVEAAESEAESILNTAKTEAKKIVADAQAQAEKILSSAKVENERLTKSSEDAIRQAGRNLLISFRESVTKELKSLLREGVAVVYSAETLAQLIVNVIESWSNKPDAEDITLILNNEDLTQVEKNILAGLKERINKGITLKASDNFDGGFRIAVNDSGVYYDYSAEMVVDMLSNYLSPKVIALMKEVE
ncbi:MAG: V-type ATP synthase subunit E [Ruminococcaceae bacterium]|nr:V-type ATP synthase subunit E [Oscillospiraceae bacterium]